MSSFLATRPEEKSSFNPTDFIYEDGFNDEKSTDNEVHVSY